MAAEDKVLIRAITAFLALPGVVAFGVPIAAGLHSRQPLQFVRVATVLLAFGTFLLLWCVREFYVCGRGTLAPWAPPRQLVTTGPYRLSRNPMYVAVIVILLGWSTLWLSSGLLIYTAVVLLAFHLRVRYSEEPWAARRFGIQWQAYATRVPRWF